MTEEFIFEAEYDYIDARRRRTRRLRVTAAVVALALLALTLLSTWFDVINLPSTPTTEPIIVAAPVAG